MVSIAAFAKAGCNVNLSTGYTFTKTIRNCTENALISGCADPVLAKETIFTPTSIANGLCVLRTLALHGGRIRDEWFTSGGTTREATVAIDAEEPIILALTEASVDVGDHL